MQGTRISTEGMRGAKRVALVRDAAFDLFNLEADLEQAPPDEVHADIRVAPGAAVSAVDVHTSWSVVRRTRARASASPTDHLLFYRIGQGGSWFRNERGEQFLTRAGSVVVGSQATAYTAAAADGRDWQFRTFRIASDSLPVSGERIRRDGFRLLPEDAPMWELVSQYLASFSDALPRLDARQIDASLGALDLLVAASLGDELALQQDEGGALNAARLVAARNFIERCVDNPRLSPELVAGHLGVSVRQLHRIFACEATTVSLDVRRLRVSRAQALLARDAARPVTDIALSCGFDSLATFYRCFRTETGMTATEWRSQCAI
jgi:AraC-like DNA-binding protein